MACKMKRKESKHMETEKMLYTFQEASKILNVTVRTLYKWAAEGRIERIKVGRGNRITAAEIERLTTKGVQL